MKGLGLRRDGLKGAGGFDGFRLGRTVEAVDLHCFRLAKTSPVSQFSVKKQPMFKINPLLVTLLSDKPGVLGSWRAEMPKLLKPQDPKPIVEFRRCKTNARPSSTTPQAQNHEPHNLDPASKASQCQACVKAQAISSQQLNHQQILKRFQSHCKELPNQVTLRNKRSTAAHLSWFLG